jgi:4-aminobutyrate aminotransferase-like enzyme
LARQKRRHASVLGLYGNVIRFLAPLTASAEIVGEGLAIVRCVS